MLVRKQILDAALTDYELRNQLIAQLQDTPISDTLFTYKYLLAVWLGSNVTLEKLRPHYVFFKEYVAAGCFAMIVLDKAINRNTEAKGLIVCRENFIQHLNLNYRMIEDDGIGFYKKLLNIISTIPSQFKKVRLDCLAELNRALQPYDPIDSEKPLKSTTKVRNDKIINTRAMVHKTITRASRRFPFHYYPFFFGANPPEARRIFLTTPDKVILDALTIIKNPIDNGVVVIALVGHFSSENTFITRDAIDFAEFFGTMVVYPNHRNYTLLSDTFAEGLDDIANDITCFAQYFHAKNKKIVLYGMCGGAAHLIMAALKLKELNIPFKIILDRSFNKYVNFFDIKTLLLASNSQGAGEFQLGLLAFLATPLLKLSFSIAAAEVNFSKKLATLNENDVLILQGKDVKNSKKVDAYIHNDNATRSFFKAQRHERRVILKKLIQLSDKIAYLSYITAYQQFSMLFTCILNLIDNEKITIAFDGDTIQDIHSIALYNMISTKNNLSVKNLVRGFIANPPQPKKDFSTFLAYSSEDFAAQYSEDLQSIIVEFIELIKENHQYLTHMTKRVAASGYKNYFPVVEQYLNDFPDCTETAFRAIRDHIK